MKLSNNQSEVLALLADGWQVGCDTSIHGRISIQKGGTGRGGESRKVNQNTFHGLYTRKLVSLTSAGFPSNTYDINEAGRKALADNPPIPAKEDNRIVTIFLVCDNTRKPLLRHFKAKRTGKQVQLLDGEKWFGYRTRHDIASVHFSPEAAEKHWRDCIAAGIASAREKLDRLTKLSAMQVKAAPVEQDE